MAKTTLKAAQSKTVQSLGNFTKLSTEKFQGTTEREKLLIVSMTTIIFVFVSYFALNTITGALDSQNKALAKIERSFKDAVPLLSQYQRLNLQRETIEARFKDKEKILGIRSYLEDIATNKAKLSGRVNIRDRKAEKFGKFFIRTPVSIEFITNDISELINLLRQITESKEPLLITSVRINKLGRRLKTTTRLNMIAQAESS